MPTKRPTRPTRKAAAGVVLHKDGPDDEPLEVDVDVTLTCECGAKTHERKEVYKETDWVSAMCSACGATYRVDVSTVISFLATAVKETGSVSGEPHVD